jgi:hypothetical protein
MILILPHEALHRTSLDNVEIKIPILMDVILQL